MALHQLALSLRPVLSKPAFISQCRFYAPKKGGGGPKVKAPKFEVIPVKKADEMKVGDPILGIQIMANQPDPVLKEMSEYPEWLWEILNEPERDNSSIAIITKATFSTSYDKEKYGPDWEFTTLDTVRVLDKRAKRAFTKSLMRFRQQQKVSTYRKKAFGID